MALGVDCHCPPVPSPGAGQAGRQSPVAPRGPPGPRPSCKAKVTILSNLTHPKLGIETKDRTIGSTFPGFALQANKREVCRQRWEATDLWEGATGENAGGDMLQSPGTHQIHCSYIWKASMGLSMIYHPGSFLKGISAP